MIPKHIFLIWLATYQKLMSKGRIHDMGIQVDNVGGIGEFLKSNICIEVLYFNKYRLLLKRGLQCLEDPNRRIIVYPSWTIY
ncbi:hypothetical protein H5410_005602, partial [Solanum commersonii]